jgi:hypothetical protein
MLAILLAFATLPGFTPRVCPFEDNPRIIKLFNGRNLDGFYTWLKGHGKNVDPNKVFTVENGMIRISGQDFGYLATDKEHDNYHLIVEFKWGEKTFAPREKGARDSGVLLHAVGEDGAAGGVWMRSIEYQMIEGGTGDIILVAAKGPVSLTAEVEKRPTGAGEKKHDEWYWKKGAPAREFTGGRVNWFGRSPEWKDVKGFRGKEDVEKPVGQWNRLECICDGDRITNILNGVVVNAAVKANPSRGKILFQSEGAELFLRRIELRPLKK